MSDVRVDEVKKPVDPRRKWLYGFAFVVWAAVSYILAQVLLMGGVWLLEELGVIDSTDANQAMFQTVATAVMWIFAISLAIGVPYLVLKQRTTLEALGLQRLPTWSEIGLAPIGYIVSLLAAGIIVNVLSEVIPGFNATETQDVGFSGLAMRYEYIVAFLTLVVIAPVAEEIFFRGYLYGKLKRYIPTWIAILVVSALFGLAHGQWNVGIVTFIMGIFLCLLRDFTGSLWPAIMVHMIRNGVAYYFLFVNPSLTNLVGG